MDKILNTTTAITLTIGATVIPATLNNGKAAQSLISKLPYTVKLNRYECDYCGIMDAPFEYNENEIHNGWKNGDIDLAGIYFSILFTGEEKSQSHNNMVTMGSIDGDLSVVKDLGSEIEVIVDLAK